MGARVPQVSVVIPAFRAAEHLPKCLAALRGQSADAASFEVIVVDDCSPDATAACAESAGATLVRHASNRGAAAARNSGAAVANGQVLLFVDADVVPEPDLVQAVLDLFASDPPAAATGRYGPEPANPGRFPRYKALWTFWCWERTSASALTSTHVQGALAAVRRDVFESLGGFDESYRGGSVEDYELSARLRERGHEVVFCDRIRGRHHFPSFGVVARNYWDRARLWTSLRRDGLGFSSGQASRRSAAGAVCALGSVAGHVALPVLPLVAPLVLAADLGWAACAAPFLVFVARREGPAFAAYSAAVHYALSAVVGAAAGSAAISRPATHVGPPGQSGCGGSREREDGHEQEHEAPDWSTDAPRQAVDPSRPRDRHRLRRRAPAS